MRRNMLRIERRMMKQCSSYFIQWMMMCVTVILSQSFTRFRQT